MPTTLRDPSQSNASLLEKKLDRIREYLEKSLNDPDLRQAILGMASSDMMALAAQLKKVIDETLSSEIDFVKEFNEIAPVIELFLKASRQTDRYLQLDQRLFFDKKSARSPRPR